VSDSVGVVRRQRQEPSGFRNLAGATDLSLLRKVRTGSESHPAYFPICSGVIYGAYSGRGSKLTLTSTLCNGVTFTAMCGCVFCFVLLELLDTEIEDIKGLRNAERTHPTPQNTSKYTEHIQLHRTHPTAQNTSNCTKHIQLHRTHPTAQNTSNCTVTPIGRSESSFTQVTIDSALLYGNLLFITVFTKIL
jgi:hypothetical protein